eukprot:TRINITY_DN5810_c4_g1_i1.p1 TRINITY_DN5810_c4_g1~~TRINITY_DN5810_c4_g1_i1.p1  ORF type:complete len:435 (-),score=116.40 TRINITY_DN5810_c4_g1_i1:81-1355(-)
MSSPTNIPTLSQNPFEKWSEDLLLDWIKKVVPIEYVPLLMKIPVTELGNMTDVELEKKGLPVGVVSVLVDAIDQAKTKGWTREEVYEWAKSIVPESYALKLKEHLIDGKNLWKLNKDRLERCGIPFKLASVLAATIEINRATENSLTPKKEPEEEKVKRLQTRGRVINEIIQTELDFVNDMKLLIEVFYNPFEENGLLNRSELETLFCGVGELIKINEDMASKFVNRKEETVRKGISLEEMPIGDIFVEAAPSLQGYKTYCTNQSDAFALLEELMECNKDFKEFLEECMSNPRCRGLGLQAWLIKPLQRLCKYPLLLREMLRNTTMNTTDYFTLLEADEKIGQTVAFVNQEKLKAEKAAEDAKKEMEKLENSIRDNTGKTLEGLTKAGRRLVKFGVLHCYHHQTKKQKDEIGPSIFRYNAVFCQ